MPELRPVGNKYWRIARITTLVFAPIILIAGAFIYTKLYGFKHALEELVYSKTDGQYALTIGTTDFQLRSLSFKFENVRIVCADSTTDRGMIAVDIPFFELQFGSLSSLFTEEFNIKRLTVDEPQIAVEASPGKQKPIMVSQELMRLYPAIESVLNRFKIELLKVNRASIQLDQKGQTAVRINFIDLLIQHWRMRELSAQSQLKLNIEKQDLILGNANVKFSAIEYNFHEHHLKFSDFHISTADSLTGSDIEVSGKTLLLQNLDYQDFYKNLKYTLKRAEIDRPVINAHFKWGKSRKRIELDKNVVTRMLKYAIGECAVDSAVIRDARVNIALQRGSDTIRIILPDVDFRMHAFSVVRDSSTFQVGEVEVNLNGSALTLSRNLSVKLDQVLFARTGDLTFKNIRLYSPGAKRPIAVISTVEVQNFNLMSLLFARRFAARSIIAENGRLYISKPSRENQKHVDKDTTYHLADLFISAIRLKNIAVTYIDGPNTLKLEGLSFSANNLRYGKDQQLEYNLKSVNASTADFTQRGHGFHANLHNASYIAGHFRAALGDISTDSLYFHIRNLSARKDANAEDFRHWQSVDIAQLELKGTTRDSRAQERPNYSTQASTIGTVHIQSLQVDLANNKNKISFSGKNISTNAVSLGNTISWPDRVLAELDDIRFNSNDLNTQARKVNINYPSLVDITDVHVSTAGINLSAAELQVRKLKLDDTDWGLSRLSAHEVMVERNGNGLLQSDSVVLLQAQWERSSGHPHIERGEIFKPVIHMVQTDKSSKPLNLDDLSSYFPNQLILHPGTLQTATGRQITFGICSGDKAKGAVACAGLKTAFKKSDLTIESLMISKTKLTIQNASLTSNRGWYAANDLEDTEISAQFQNISVAGFSINDIVETNSAKELEFEMDHLSLDLRRDKRLPDPPEQNRPTTLDGMIKLPENIDIKTINIRDGKIQYRQVSDKTGEEGYVMLDKLSVKAEFDSLSDFISLKAKTNLYNSGIVRVNYQTTDTSSFRLNINIKELDLTKLNEIVMPLQALRIRSGYLQEYNMNINADDEKASGEAMITYKGLHLEIFKHNEPERKNLGSEVLTLLADGIILKHTKENASAVVNHTRVKHKSVFHYWVTSAVNGAIGAVRKGKRK